MVYVHYLFMLKLLSLFTIVIIDVIVGRWHPPCLLYREQLLPLHHCHCCIVRMLVTVYLVHDPIN